MKSKNIALIILAAIIVIPIALLLFDFGNLDFSFNFIKYHSVEVDGREFSFYGSFGNIGKIKISSDENTCTVPFSADADIFDRNIAAVELCDVNSDGRNDILVLTSIDEESDVHRTLFISGANDYARMGDTDIVNFRVDGNKIISEDITLEYMAETVAEYTVPYRKCALRREYQYSDGEFFTVREYSVSYYSETNVYCHGYWEYDDQSGSLLCVFEDWLSPKEYAEKSAELQKMFKIQLP